MRKIPTLFQRDAVDRAHVLPEINPECRWVIDGEGVATRKYDGTCVMLAESGDWWARREVKPGKIAPPNYVPIGTDEITGKTMGWEPIGQSAFAKFHAEALAVPYGVAQNTRPGHWQVPAGPARPGTYELCGPRINGNPEGIAEQHLLIRHGYTAAIDHEAMVSLPHDFDGLRDWLRARSAWEGIVWHHPDGRMAKLKRRDFAATTTKEN